MAGAALSPAPTAQSLLMDWDNYIQSVHPKGIDLGLERMQALVDGLGLRFECPVVLVGGTNGKGSVTTLLSYLFTKAGWRVGTTISPHLECLTERYCINGSPISEQALVEAFTHVQQVATDKEIAPRYFEMITAVGLWAIAQQKPDVMIIEVGLGGRLDATNVFDHDLSIITSINYDHTEWLGPTLEEIACHKAGIARQDKPTLVGASAARIPALGEALTEIGAHIETEGQDFSCTLQDTGCFMPTHVALAARAFETIVKVRADLSDITQIQVPCRHERITHAGRTFLLDVAHNEEGFSRLAQTLQDTQMPHVAIWHSLNTKNVGAAPKALAAHVSHWFIPPIADKRASACCDLKAAAGEHATICDTVSAAIEAAVAANQPIVVFGGFNVVSAVRQQLSTNLGKELWKRR